MRIVLITQEDRFFLPDCISDLLRHLGPRHEVCAAVVSDVSPFGKKEKLFAKLIKTLRIFGLIFTFRWAFRYAFALLTSRSVSSVLKNYNVEILHLTSSINDSKSLEKIRIHNPDLLISIAGNEIFKAPLINLAPMGCLNLHTALLPKYRGLMPSFWVLCNKETHTGVSVFQVDEGIDSGPIVVQKKIQIKDMSQEQLILKTKKIGMIAIAEAVEKIEKNDENFLPNDDADMTYFSFPTRADVKKFLRGRNRFF